MLSKYWPQSGFATLGAGFYATPGDPLAPGQRRLDSAVGYLQLGMVSDAHAEIDALPEELTDSADVLSLRACVYLEAGAWEALREVAGLLAAACPGESQHWIWLGHATRRCQSLAAARRILKDALVLHRDEAAIHFNLACYAAQAGDLTAAREHLVDAIRLHPEVPRMALKDPDLEPLWHDRRSPS
jgi:Tfp pilus assembly protein PilF